MGLLVAAAAREALEGAAEARQHLGFRGAPGALDALPVRGHVRKPEDRGAHRRQRFQGDAAEQAGGGHGRARRGQGIRRRVGGAAAQPLHQRGQRSRGGGVTVPRALLRDAPGGEQQHRSQRAAQRRLAVALDRGPHGVALHEELLLAARLQAGGGAVAVVHGRVGHDADVAARQSHAPSEVDVVVVGEEAVVEAACRGVGGARDGERSAVGEERLAGGRELGPHRLAVVVLEPAGLETDRAAHEVEAPAVPAEHAGGRARVLGVHGVHEPADGVRFHAHVVVEEHEHVAARGRHAGVVAAGEPAVLAEGDEGDRGEARGHQRPRAVGGSVVHADEFEAVGRVGAGEQGGEAGVEMRLAVPVDDDDRDRPAQSLGGAGGTGWKGGCPRGGG